MFLAIQITVGFRFAKDDNFDVNRNLNTIRENWQLESNDEITANIEEPDQKIESKNRSIEVLTESVEKRQNHHLEHGCGCPTLHERIYFDNGIFPYSWNGKKCDTSSNTESICKHGYHCKEFTHKILVLKSKASHRRATYNNVHELPEHIKTDYYWDYEVRNSCKQHNEDG